MTDSFLLPLTRDNRGVLDRELAAKASQSSRGLARVPSQESTLLLDHEITDTDCAVWEGGR